VRSRVGVGVRVRVRLSGRARRVKSQMSKVKGQRSKVKRDGHRFGDSGRAHCSERCMVVVGGLDLRREAATGFVVGKTCEEHGA